MNFEELSDNYSMNHLIAEFYQEASRILGHEHAREFICSTISTVISEFEEEGIELSAEEFEKRLCSELSDIIEIAKKTKAA